MPPLVYETVAWFRHYSWLPFPAPPGETGIGAAPDPARTARAAPVAGAIVGGLAGLVMVLAAALGAADFVAAAAATLALLAITGGQTENTLAAIAGRREGPAPALQYGILAVGLAVLARTGALDALLPFGVWGTAFALAGACAFARAAAIGFTLLRPAGPETAETATANAALQWLAISGLAIAIAAVLPFFGLGAAVAGIAAAAGAVALVSSFLPRDAGNNDRAFLAVATLAAEIAFLIAVRAFSGS